MSRINWITVFFVFVLFMVRLFYGIQINFSHEDYRQVYLIGLEHAFSENWSYWGPDVVWSKTRLPGAMQGFLAGAPIALTKNMYSPLIFSNLISAAGLIGLAVYTRRRFPSLSLNFILALFLIFPFGFFNGVVLLNTAYLLFSGALLFIAVFELFVYRKNELLPRWLSFFFLGFAFVFTFQLHLSWVMFLPFLGVLFFLEFKDGTKPLGRATLFFLLGTVLPLITLLPTLLKYGDVMMNNVEGNLVFEPSRLLSGFDLLIRYIGMSTFDITPKDEVKLAIESSSFVGVFMVILKVFTAIQFIGILVGAFFVKRTKEYKKTLLLMLLTFVMALIMYLMSNKNLDIRTYILLFPIPLTISIYVYNRFFKIRWLKYTMYAGLTLPLIAFISIGSENKEGPFSFKGSAHKIERAIENENPYLYDNRRITIMDEYN